MQSLLQIGLSNAVCAALLALLAAAVSWLVPRRPALSHAAWVLVLLKLLTPPLWTIHLPSFPPAVLSPVPAPAALEAPLVQMPNAGGERIVPAGAVPTRREPGISPGTVAAVAWLAGSMACAALVAIRLIRFGRILRYARPAPDETRRQAQDVALRIGLRTAPPVWMLLGPVSPMLWSAFGYARVLLPAELWGRLSPAQQSRLLAHELAHLRRGDQWVRLLEVAATVAYWWNPFLWWSRRELHVAEEACCDAWVAWAFAEDVHVYTSALVEAIDFVSRPSVPLIASGIGSYRTLRRRLVMIEQGKNVRGLGGLGIAVVAALMTALPLSVKRAAAEPQPAPAKQPADAAARSAPVKQPADAAARSAPAPLPTADPDDLLFAAMQEGQAKAWYSLERSLPGLHVDKVAFSDVVDFLRDTSGIRVEVDWPGLEALGVKRDTPVTVDIHNVKFHKAVAIVLETVGGGRGKVVYTIDKDKLLILPADAVPVLLQQYDVKDLVAGQPDFGPKLIAHLTETIDPSSWQEHNGKKGMIKLEGNTLYVAQTPENQRRVVNTLVLIRDQRQELRARGTRDN